MESKKKKAWVLMVPYAEHAASFSPEIVALVDNDSIYSYNLPLLSLLSLVACMARDILDDSVVEQTNDIPLKSLGQMYRKMYGKMSEKCRERD